MTGTAEIMRLWLVAAGVALLIAITADSARATTIPGTVVDQTSQTSYTFTVPTTCCSYLPHDAAIGRSGSGTAEVTWSAQFDFHPLRFETAGIAGVDMGDSATRQLPSGLHKFYCAVHGGRNGQGMAGEIYVAGPRAALSPASSTIAPGGQVTLDAGATDITAYANSLVTWTYEFDPEGDGSFLPAGTATTVTATYPSAGTFTPRVRVVDSAGRTSEATATVVVGTPGPAAPAKTPAVSALTSMPSTSRCVNRRRGLKVTVRDAAGGDVRSAVVRVNGRVARRITVVRGSASATLKGLSGRPRVQVSVTLASGTTLSRTLRYRVCPR